mgnify:CR=1 FL=1
MRLLQGNQRWRWRAALCSDTQGPAAIQEDHVGRDAAQGRRHLVVVDLDDLQDRQLSPSAREGQYCTFDSIRFNSIRFHWLNESH